ncbi:synaptotagmin-like protein 2 [Etheostoma cragini]|uniref:synaptotagmin-like protein 2 n=1 Tax=Etheostoma cragini TaxID=417921 RepID=UPI00155ED3E9|nr:synaptotagmin-like protein 2 [Etheostoma cragini]
MIDLSHLTEEEQGAIMTVLRRDAELKKAEEERIRKLGKILDGGSQPDTQRKYRTGEWFYEAKSRRHMDKIHGSEIILASMNKRKAGLDGSLRIERSKTPSGQGSDIVAPPKPARSLEPGQHQDLNDAEKENLNAVVRSPRRPRHNPFNRPSLIVVEPPGTNDDMSTSQDQVSSETEPISPAKSQPAEASQTSGGSLTSEGSSVGFRPVPKKRTFLSRRTSSQSESNSLALDAQGGSAGIVPATRLSLQRGSSDSSNQSYLKGRDEIPQKSIVPNQVPQSAQPFRPLDKNSQLDDISLVLSYSSLERENTPPSRSVDASSRSADPNILLQLSDPSIATHNLHPDRENNSSVGTAGRQEELSLPQSIVDPDPPESYDLNFIDKSDQQAQKKSNQKHAFQLSTQTASPTGDEEDSIARVLDWFCRSTDSIDSLRTDNGPKATKSSEKHVEISKIRGEESLRKDAGDMISDETLEMRRNNLQRQNNEAKELRATGRETQEEVKKDTRERMPSQEVKDGNDESQPPQITHLKSFWEKSNPGPKILISKSIMSSNNKQKPIHLLVEKDEETVKKPLRAPGMPTVSGVYNMEGIYDKFASNHQEKREQQKDTGDNVQSNNKQEVDSRGMNTLTQRNNNDPTYNLDYLKLAASPQVSDRRGSETEILSVTRLSTPNQSSPQPDSISQSREISLQTKLSQNIPLSQLDTDPDSEKLHMSRNHPYMDYKQGGNDIQITPKTQICRGSSEEVKRMDSEDESVLSSMSPKRQENTFNKDRITPSNRQGLPHQESIAEKIKQLKSFWETERNKSPFYTSKPTALGEGKVARGANQAKLNKRYTKSEYDLTSIGNDSGSDEEDCDRNQNYNVLPFNQRLDKLSPTLGSSRIQFNTLREFWDEATSEAKGSFSFDRPKSPKRKEPISAPLSSQELRCADPEVYIATEKTRPAMVKSSPPAQNRSKSPHDRPTGSRAANEGKNNQFHYTTAESRRSSKDSSREEKSTKQPSSSGKETRSPKSRKDSFSYSSSRGKSMRRTTSMFSLSVPGEEELKMDVGPIHSQSRKQRHETETQAPLARACVPRDYRHYLGMTDETSVHASFAPPVKDQGSEGKSAHGFDLDGPMRASTPVSSEERNGRRGGKASQRPLWANYSSSDAGQESSVSSTSETWSRNGSNRENDRDGPSLVRKALRRAEARPKNLAKSMEDITASLSPRQERSQDPTANMRRISDVSSIPSPSSSLFSDPEHLKKMSKSVPSFLQKEDVGRDTDFTYEDSDPPGRLMMGRSLNNLTGSPGMASLSSLSGSVMTMYSGDFGNVEVQGNIKFSINYIQKLREFHIFVVECQDLAAVDPKRGRSDPYVKSYLVPDKANLGKRKTSVKKKTLNPTFNEILRYRVRMEYLRTQTLILSVWHHDTFGRNSFLGEVEVDLSSWDFDHTQMNYLALKARAAPTLAPSHGRGEMRLAVRFLPQIIHSEGLIKAGPNTGEIHIWVKECKNLPLIRATIDPYVKCFVLPDTSRKSRQKTRVLRRTVDPVFNHTMVYDGIKQADLSEACVELTVWDRDRLASNLLGGLRLGAGTGRSYGALVDWMDSTPYEAALWERMMATPNEWVEDVLPLRLLNSSKTGFK